MKPLVITSGEPAGIGPDLCLSLAGLTIPLVVLGDKVVLEERAARLGITINFVEYSPDRPVSIFPNTLNVYPVSCKAKVYPGQLDPQNASYVLTLLEKAISACLKGEFSGLVTAPVHKGVINQAGFSFTGHTEFLADVCGSKQVVMMLASKLMRVALVTTHLPLQKVAETISQSLVMQVIQTVDEALRHDFGIAEPQMAVAGLNPHAGEGGYLGCEEKEIISPALELLQAQGINARGPYPADTLFASTEFAGVDAFVVMYHDQGLPVLKYSDFGGSVNVSLGLPIIRTSVDHGTALDLAGTGKANPSSLIAAVEMAKILAMTRSKNA